MNRYTIIAKIDGTGEKVFEEFLKDKGVYLEQL